MLLVKILLVSVYYFNMYVVTGKVLIVSIFDFATKFININIKLSAFRLQQNFQRTYIKVDTWDINIYSYFLYEMTIFVKNAQYASVPFHIEVKCM